MRKPKDIQTNFSAFPDRSDRFTKKQRFLRANIETSIEPSIDDSINSRMEPFHSVWRKGKGPDVMSCQGSHNLHDRYHV
jgi:hypothetical protein